MENKTTSGLVQAAVNLHEQAVRRQKTPTKYPRYAYERAGVAIHFKRRPKPLQRLQAINFSLQMRKATDDEQRREIMKNFRNLPVNFVPVKRAILIDHSRYTGEKLRAIRASQAAWTHESAAEGVSYDLAA